MPKKGFNLNWSYTTNCRSDPSPEPNVSTFMGRSMTGPFEDEVVPGFRPDRAPMYKSALGWKSDSILGPNSEPKEDPEEEEIRYLDETHNTIEVLDKTSDTVVFEMNDIWGWIYIRCNTKEAQKFVKEHVESSFDYEFGLVHHEEKRRQVDSSRGTSLIRRTGAGTGTGPNDGPYAVATLFELQNGSGETIAKALCAYCNLNLENPGPTIELFEVAGGFRRKGYGKLLLKHITDYFEETFCDDMCKFDGNVRFNVCYCTSSHAANWFMRQGFRQWDEFGEEFGKYLAFD
ncbi:unnamed protein product [Cylindrotheca closterium]|uniref:N-acetyltransferase domain-containing protein n=1 Tax=Cylindrotheca closterium TaxID=2856 RepID=A0AAD2FK04_9STRA|nr:unnamed protein product [Cylindrotheca closterium]